MKHSLTSVWRRAAYWLKSALILSLTVAGTGGCALAEQPTSGVAVPTRGGACMALERTNLERVTDSPGRIVQAHQVEEQPASAQDQARFALRGVSQGIPVHGLDVWPEHCLVEGYVTPDVKFAMMLPPAESWNGRFWLAACEGWCGAVNLETMVPALHHGYAVITNNGGHYGDAPFDAIWAYRNLEARINFAHRANHVSAEAGKAIVESFYGDAPAYSYIAGVSKGGNAGLMAAQRYPEDFDGIFSKAPVVYYNPKNAAHMLWVAKTIYPDGETPLLYADKAPLIHAAAVAACDGLDGLEDGIITDPRVCDFDPVVLLCEAGQSEADNECLNAAQVEAVRQIYAPPATEDGEVYFAFPNDPGSETEWAGVILPIRNSPARPAFLEGAVSGLYMAFKESPEPGYDWLNFDYPAHVEEIAEMSEILDPDSLDLSAFKARGGRMIIAHGWSDGLVSPNMTIDWFEKMQAHMGGVAETETFAQLYLLPGVHHVFAGTGPYVVDAHTALVKWVEEGIAPDELLATDAPDATPYRERPIYPYPAVAVYDGTGDPAVASSFSRSE